MADVQGVGIFRCNGVLVGWLMDDMEWPKFNTSNGLFHAGHNDLLFPGNPVDDHVLPPSTTRTIDTIDKEDARTRR